jgi:hypothetical protein
MLAGRRKQLRLRWLGAAKFWAVVLPQGVRAASFVWVRSSSSSGHLIDQGVNEDIAILHAASERPGYAIVESETARVMLTLLNKRQRESEAPILKTGGSLSGTTQSPNLCARDWERWSPQSQMWRKTPD